jgi:hypothetical protein
VGSSISQNLRFKKSYDMIFVKAKIKNRKTFLCFACKTRKVPATVVESPLLDTTNAVSVSRAREIVLVHEVVNFSKLLQPNLQALGSI